MRNQPYILTEPARRTTPVVFSSPHSGREYSRAFRRAAVLGQRALRSSEDAFVDLLFSNVTLYGAPLLAAVAPRAYLDLNRGPDELDPALIEGVKPGRQNLRVASGLGVIPRVVSGGREIYRGKLSAQEAERRLATWWHPYHSRLQGLLDESHANFGQAILIDCHSMPNEAIRTLCRGAKPRPEIVLGDRYGASADCEIVDRIEASFVEAGLTVARNKPFAGAYIAQRYGQPAQGRHVVQIEIDRALYMNETALRPNNNFAALKAVLDNVIAGIVKFGRRQGALAAE